MFKDYYKIKPAARLISTIGSDLIKDVHAAIVELVKNAYDADANKVDIYFSTLQEVSGADRLKIIIKDDGHGMSLDTVVNKWMVPATKDKLLRKRSPKGRILQGRKGIGRYATASLGQELLLQTIDTKENKTVVYIDWDEFENAEFLDEVQILIENFECKELSGTTLDITGNHEKLEEWNKKEIEILLKELRKLLSPINSIENDFKIKVHFLHFPIEKDKDNEYIYKDEKVDIEPYPLAELYDYRLSGQISSYGKVEMIYENKSIKGIPDEHVSYNIDLPVDQYCGPLKIDLRVFDRDAESLDALILKGLKDPDTGNYLRKQEARELLNELTGVGIYREDFRIRPYGEAGYDWLELDKQRFLNPSLRISQNQIFGIITIASEEKSNLEEKSARDGLKENKYYETLKKIVKNALSELEKRRQYFREKTGKGRKHVKLEEELSKLFDFSVLSKNVQKKLDSIKVKPELIKEIQELILKEESDKANLLEGIKNTIAVYQGQATLGKIIMVLLHEGRKPLGYFRNQSPLISSWLEELKVNKDRSLLDIIINRLTTTKQQAEILVKLFDKINPLAVKKRSKPKDFSISESIEKVYLVFEGELKENKIEFQNDVTPDLKFFGWEEDFYVIFTNLVENSIYWLPEKKAINKKIIISANDDKDALVIDYRDNGPGIEQKYIEDDVIFEPTFSTKPEDKGTGLGLAIAGEATMRNNGILKAIYDPDGAYFRIEFPKNI